MKYVLRGILLFTLCVSFMACDDLDLDNEDAGGEVIGIWEKFKTEGSNEFVLISNNTLGFFYYNASRGCMTTDVYRVAKRDGTGFFQVTKDDGSPLKVYAVSRNGDRIHLRDIDDTQRDIQRYWPSEKTNIEDFAPVCYNNDLTGTWQLDSDEIEEYVSVSSLKFEIASFDTTESCFQNVKFDVIDIDMPEMVLRNQANASEEFSLDFTLADSVMTISRNNAGTTFQSNYLASDTLITQLSPFCTNSSSTTVFNKPTY
ncbi:MAG: hypothetical protein JJ895_15790 [Balneolaceae bacterium]|nr:hypothetical protein [Balneolaceae bacterium]